MDFLSFWMPENAIQNEPEANTFAQRVLTFFRLHATLILIVIATLIPTGLLLLAQISIPELSIVFIILQAILGVIRMQIRNNS